MPKVARRSRSLCPPGCPLDVARQRIPMNLAVWRPPVVAHAQRHDLFESCGTRCLMCWLRTSGLGARPSVVFSSHLDVERNLEHLCSDLWRGAPTGLTTKTVPSTRLSFADVRDGRWWHWTKHKAAADQLRACVRASAYQLQHGSSTLQRAREERGFRCLTMVQRGSPGANGDIRSHQRREDDTNISGRSHRCGASRVDNGHSTGAHTSMFPSKIHTVRPSFEARGGHR